MSGRSRLPVILTTIFLAKIAPYHILSLLEVVRRELILTDYFLYLTPADSVKKLTSVPGLVKAVHFRPSLLRKANGQYSRLDENQRELFETLVAEGDAREVSDSQVFDAAISYLNYRKQTEELGKLLVRRSQLPASSEERSVFPPLRANNRPDLGHDPQLLQINGGSFEGDFFQELRYQTSYHDLLANDMGHEAFSEIVFPALTVRRQRSRWFLEELNLFSITSHAPWSRLSRRWSWALKFRLYQNRTFPSCGLNSCLKGQFYTGTGLATHLWSRSYLASAMALVNMETGNHLGAKGHRIGPQFKALFLANPNSWYKSQISYTRFYGLQDLEDLPTRQIWEWGHSFSLRRSMELRAIFSHIDEKKTSHQFKLGLLFYLM